MNNKWRLVESLNAFITPEDEIIMYPNGEKKKAYRSGIVKYIKANIPGVNLDALREITISNNHFELRVDEFLQVFGKCSEFPNPDKFYRILNYCEEALGEILTQTKCENGAFEGDFEAIFSDLYGNTIVKMITEEMKEYDNCFDEMIRLIGCETNKKTRKWIPGHRYDLPNETYYYLGKFYSHREDEIASPYLPDTEMNEVYLVCKNAKECKNISDVFKTKLYSDVVAEEDGIKALNKIPLMVDSGEYLVDDITTMDSFYENSVELSMKNNVNLKCFMDSFNYKKNILDSSYTLRQSDHDYIVEKIQQYVFDFLLKYWETDMALCYDATDPKKLINLGPKNDTEKNVNAILLGISKRDYIGDINAFSSSYYPKALSEYGIDMKWIIETMINNFSTKTSIHKDFNSYLKYYKKYFMYRDLKNAVITIDQYGKNETISSKLPLKLSNEILSMVNDARISNGVGIKYLGPQIKNSWQKIYRAEITIEDIVNKYGQYSVPEDIRTEIMQQNLRTVAIEFDPDKQIKL